MIQATLAWTRTAQTRIHTLDICSLANVGLARIYSGKDGELCIISTDPTLNDHGTLISQIEKHTRYGRP